MNDFEILGEIIPDFPATRVMLISDTSSSLAKWLIEFIATREASLDIRALNEKSFQKMQELDIKKQKLITLELLDQSSQKYNPHGYKFDTLFLYLEEAVEEKEHVLTRVYASMKNAGGVVVIMPHDNPMTDAMELDLDEANFVAINPIDISLEYKVYYAKKMHGWDGAR